MSSIKGVWIVTEEPQTASAITYALDRDERFRPAGVCPNLRELESRIARTPAPVVLLDIDPDPIRLLGDLRAFSGQHVQTRFIVVSSSRKSELVLEAMQSGARQFLPKRDIDNDLGSLLDRIVPEVSSRFDEGTVFTVLSASGGCGATTVAVNVASELQLFESDPVLLVDLDIRYGAAATYLGLEGEYGVADLLARAGSIDDLLVRTTAVSHSDRLDVLLSPVSTNFSRPMPLHLERLDEAIEACKSAYPLTVIDAPGVSMDTAATLAHLSSAVIIVFQLAVKDIRTTRAMMAALAERGVRPEQILTVANRYEKRSGNVIAYEDAKRALGGHSPFKVRNDFRSAIEGINFGRPLNQSAPRSALRSDLRELAAELQQNFAKRSLITAGN